MKSLLENYAKNSNARKRERDEQEQGNSNSIPRKETRNSDRSYSSSSPIMDDYEGPPHFLILGAQKAGTMAAVKNLNKHPEVACLSEEHYFDLGWHSRTPKSYRSLFEKFRNTEKRVFGEKTPEYGYVEECHSRIRSVCSPSTKFIFMIRNPVKRAYSAWNMNVKRNFEINLFDECVDTNLKNLKEYRSYGTAEYHYVQRGFYLEQIERFLQTFPDRNNLLIVVAEHIRSDPDGQYNRIYDFLGVRRIAGMKYDEDHVGSYTTPMSTAISTKLRKIYEPHNERLFKFLGYRIPEWSDFKPMTVAESSTISNVPSSNIQSSPDREINTEEQKF